MKKNMKLIFISLMILLVMLLACSSQPPENAGREEKTGGIFGIHFDSVESAGQCKKKTRILHRGWILWRGKK